MDLTPQDVRDVQFREKMRGYHQDDVDEFLVQVATTLERFSLRLHDAETRASSGSARDSEIATTEESLKRTLILAQRTADLAMKEAREEADRLLADARAEHERLQTQSDEIKRQLIDESQVDIKAELAALEERRDALAADVERLDAYLEAEKGRLSALLQDTLQNLDDGSYALQPKPELSEPPRVVLAADEAITAGPPGTPDADRRHAAPNGKAPIPDAVNGSGGPAAHADGSGAPSVSDVGDPAIDGGPATQTMAAVLASAAGADADTDRSEVDLRDDAEVDDPFLAELRLAVTDDQPLGPAPEGDHGTVRSDEVEEIDFYERDREAGGRLGSRLRRRR